MAELWAHPARAEVSICDQTSRVSYVSTDPHGHYEAHEMNLDVDAERGPEKSGKLPGSDYF
jgi:hypothetical protein